MSGAIFRDSIHQGIGATTFESRDDNEYTYWEYIYWHSVSTLYPAAGFESHLIINTNSSHKKTPMVHRILAPVVFLGLSFWIIDRGDIDTAIQDWIYDPAAHAWPITKSDRLLRLIFYDAPKIAIIAFAAGVFAALLWSFWDQRWAAYRRRMAFLLVILALVPGIASLGKAWTNIYCPAQLSRYGGSVPRTGLLEPYPKTFVQEKRGRCFPAGHASGGFALLALFFVLNRPAARIGGLMTGLGAGWLMGGYQMLIGAHFFSHTVTTMALAWILCLLIEPLILRKSVA